MNSKELAWKIRRHAIEMVHTSGASHIGAILSAADIVAVLYTDVLNISPDRVEDPLRDRFIMSKGHAGVAVYAALAEKGFFPLECLKTYYQNESKLSGHISHKNVSGVELSTGSLGHGCAVACGMALAGKAAKKEYQVYTLIGDGECNEGSVWETALIANKYKLDNFTIIIDRNFMQAMGTSAEVMPVSNLKKIWEDIGWTVYEVVDGNDHDQLKKAFETKKDKRPRCIIANTVKGKGISFMEDSLLWHYRDPQNEYYEKAVDELEESHP